MARREALVANALRPDRHHERRLRDVGMTANLLCIASCGRDRRAPCREPRLGIHEGSDLAAAGNAGLQARKHVAKDREIADVPGKEEESFEAMLRQTEAIVPADGLERFVVERNRAG